MTTGTEDAARYRRTTCPELRELWHRALNVQIDAAIRCKRTPNADTKTGVVAALSLTAMMFKEYDGRCRNYGRKRPVATQA